MKEEITEPLLDDVESIDIDDDIEPIDINDDVEVKKIKEDDSQESVILNYIKNDEHFEIKDGDVYVKLDTPVETMDKRLIDVVKVREPRLLDMRRARKSNYSNDEDATLGLTMLLTGLDKSFFNKLKYYDSDRLWLATKYFLVQRPMTKILQKMR